MKTTLAIFGVLFALCAKADYLYWMVDTDSAGAYDYTTAVLRNSNGSISVPIDTGSAELGGYSGNLNDRIALYQADVGGFYSDIGSGYSEQSFFVELFNGNQWLAQSQLVTPISANIYSGTVSTPASVPAHFGSYAVPEPTSGLLFVIGGMLLGLKRKRQV